MVHFMSQLHSEYLMPRYWLRIISVRSVKSFSGWNQLCKAICLPRVGGNIHSTEILSRTKSGRQTIWSSLPKSLSRALIFFHLVFLYLRPLISESYCEFSSVTRYRQPIKILLKTFLTSKSILHYKSYQNLVFPRKLLLKT